MSETSEGTVESSVGCFAWVILISVIAIAIVIANISITNTKERTKQIKICIDLPVEQRADCYRAVK